MPEDGEQRVGTLINSFRADLGWFQKDSERHPRRIFLNLLREGIAARDSKAREFALAIQERLFIPEAGEDLNPSDRQRCLITILTTRPERFPLALHIFLGLLEGIPVAEMRSIFFLVGTYAGVPGMVSGIDLFVEVLHILDHELADRADAPPGEILKRIFGRLLATFSVQPPAEQLIRALVETTGLTPEEVKHLLANARQLVRGTPQA